MYGKRLIRFYFAADKLNGALDNLIIKNALNTRDYIRGGEFYAERIIDIIGIKCELSRLWEYLDKVMAGLAEGERMVLEFYGGTRTGIKNLPDDWRREIKRTVVKFTRHARFIARYGEGVRLVKKFYALL